MTLVYHTGLKGYLLVKPECLSMVLTNLVKCGYMIVSQEQGGRDYETLQIHGS